LVKQLNEATTELARKWPLQVFASSGNELHRLLTGRFRTLNDPFDYPAIGQAWRTAWEHVIPFFAFAPAIPK
jgi:transposase-like protein